MNENDPNAFNAFDEQEVTSETDGRKRDLSDRNDSPLFDDDDDEARPSEPKKRVIGDSSFLHGSRTLILILGSSIGDSSKSVPTVRFLASKMPFPESVLKYFFLKDHVVVEFVDSHYALKFLYMYYDTGIQCEDGSVITVEFAKNQDEGIDVVMPSSRQQQPSESGKVLFCLVYNAFPLENFEKYGKVVKLIELPELDRVKRVIMEFKTEVDFNNTFEKLKNHQSLKLYKSKIPYLEDTYDQTESIHYVATSSSTYTMVESVPSHSKPGTCVIQVTGFTSHKVNCDTIFILFGVYGDVLKTKVNFNTPTPCAYVEFKNEDGAERAIRFLGKNGTPCPLYNDIIQISYAPFSVLEEPTTLEEGEEFKAYLGSPLHRFTKGSATGRIKNIDHVYPPNRVLCISNINYNSQSSTIESEFMKYNLRIENIKFFGHKQKLGTKMALVSFPTLNDAVTALVECHDIKIDDYHININFADNNANNNNFMMMNRLPYNVINRNMGMPHQRHYSPMGTYTPFAASGHALAFPPTAGSPQFQNFVYSPRGRGGNAYRGNIMVNRGRGRGNYTNYNNDNNYQKENTTDDNNADNTKYQ